MRKFFASLHSFISISPQQAKFSCPGPTTRNPVFPSFDLNLLWFVDTIKVITFEGIEVVYGTFFHGLSGGAVSLCQVVNFAVATSHLVDSSALLVHILRPAKTNKDMEMYMIKSANRGKLFSSLNYNLQAKREKDKRLIVLSYYTPRESISQQKITKPIRSRLSNLLAARTADSDAVGWKGVASSTKWQILANASLIGFSFTVASTGTRRRIITDTTSFLTTFFSTRH